MATFRQKLVAQKMSEFVGISVSKAMVDSGYAPSSAEQPHRLTQSNGWKELTKNWFISDEDVLRVHSEMLDAVHRKRYLFPLSMSNKEIQEIIEFDDSFKLNYVERKRAKKVAHYIAPDYRVQIKALDLVFRIKGRYAQGRMIAKGEIGQDPYENMADEELMTKLRELDKNNPICRYCLQPKPKIEQSPSSERITPP